MPFPTDELAGDIARIAATFEQEYYSIIAHVLDLDAALRARAEERGHEGGSGPYSPKRPS